MATDKIVSAVAVELPSALVRLFPGSVERVQVDASSVGEAIDALNAHWPGMRDRLVDSTPRIRRNINVFVEGKRAALETPLKPGADIVIRIAMIG
jgi:molybdopterin converting factor small subunit